MRRVPLSAAVLLLAMGEMLPGLGIRNFFGASFGGIQFALATPVEKLQSEGRKVANEGVV